MAERRKVVLITGASSGLGMAFAEGFHRAGYALVLHAFSNVAALSSLVERIVADNGECESVLADLRDPDAPLQIIDCVRRRFGALDVLVNNASTFSDKQLRRSTHDILNETAENWEESLAVNARAPFFLMQAAHPLLSAAANVSGSTGCIINLLDESISSPFLSRAAHSVSKSALAAITTLGGESFKGKVRVYGLELATLEAAEIPKVAAFALALAKGEQEPVTAEHILKFHPKIY